MNTPEIDYQEIPPPIASLARRVGIPEAKAAAYLLIGVGEQIGPGVLNRRVAAAQLPDDVRETNVTVYTNYCASYVAGGVVEPRQGETTGYTAYKKLCSPQAEAVAGALLDFSQGITLGLRELLPSEEPRHRLAILASLVGTSAVTSMAEVSRRTGVDWVPTVHKHLRELERLGIIDAELSAGTREMNPLLQLNTSHPQLAEYTDNYIVSLIASNPEGIRRRELEDLCGVGYLTARGIQKEVKKLVARGVLTAEGRASHIRNAVILNPQWREPITDLVGRLVRIGHGEELDHWVARGKEIVGSPEQLTPLIHKSFNSSIKSRAARDPSQSRKSIILGEPSMIDGVGFADLSDRLADRLSRGSIKNELARLLKLGLVCCTKDPEGRNLWSVAPEDKT